MPTQPKLHALFDRTRFFRHAKTHAQPSVHLTPRDERLLEIVYRYRVIDTATLRALMRHEASPHAFWRRLRILWRAQYLDRTPEALYLIKFTGQETNLVWALGRVGYAALAPVLNLPMDNHQSRRMTQLNQEIKASSLAHDLASNRGRACIELAASPWPATVSIKIIVIKEACHRYTCRLSFSYPDHS